MVTKSRLRLEGTAIEVESMEESEVYRRSCSCSPVQSPEPCVAGRRFLSIAADTPLGAKGRKGVESGHPRRPPQSSSRDARVEDQADVSLKEYSSPSQQGTRQAQQPANSSTLPQLYGGECGERRHVTRPLHHRSAQHETKQKDTFVCNLPQYVADCPDAQQIRLSSWPRNPPRWRYPQRCAGLSRPARQAGPRFRPPSIPVRVPAYGMVDAET